MFKKATKSQSKLRLAIVGVSGSGKTFTSLRIAKALGSKIAFIDTERGSASKYANDIVPFDVLELEEFSPRNYVQAIKAAEREGYDVLIIDSLSHAWMGKGGALEMVDEAASRSKSKNSFMAWRDVTPEHNALVEAILGARMHVIATMRAKTEYVLEPGANGTKIPTKIGMAPVQREGMEYEFDVIGDMDLEHKMIVSKSRCAALDKKTFREPGEEIGEALNNWLSDGAPVVTPVEKLIAGLRTAQTEVDYVELRTEAIKLRPSMSIAEREVVKEELDLCAARIARNKEDAEEAAAAEAARREAAQ